MRIQGKRWISLSRCVINKYILVVLLSISTLQLGVKYYSFICNGFSTLFTSVLLYVYGHKTNVITTDNTYIFIATTRYIYAYGTSIFLLHFDDLNATPMLFFLSRIAIQTQCVNFLNLPKALFRYVATKSHKL